VKDGWTKMDFLSQTNREVLCLFCTYIDTAASKTGSGQVGETALRWRAIGLARDNLLAVTHLGVGARPVFALVGCPDFFLWTFRVCLNLGGVLHLLLEEGLHPVGAGHGGLWLRGVGQQGKV